MFYDPDQLNELFKKDGSILSYHISSIFGMYKEYEQKYGKR